MQNNRQRITVSFCDHTEKDFTKVYKKLLDNYADKTQTCPALLLLDKVDPMIVQSPDGDQAVILNRNSDRLLGDLKKILRKQELQLDRDALGGLYTFWCPEYHYYTWYTWLLQICEYLQISAPGFFICTTMPGALSYLRGAVLPGGSASYVSDLFLKASNNPLMGLQVLLHELRHCWQHKYHPDWFEDYFSYTPDNAVNYFNQKVELDADAFSFWVLSTHGITFALDDVGTERSRQLRAYMTTYDADNTARLQLSYLA